MRHGPRSETRSLTDQTKSMGETMKKPATGMATPKGLSLHGRQGACYDFAVAFR